MDTMMFYVQGSQPEPYRVTVEKDGGNLNAYCTCRAGSNGQACKHVLRILSGNSESVLNVDEQKLRAAVDWIDGSDVETALRGLAEAETSLDMAKKALAMAKKNLSRALKA